MSSRNSMIGRLHQLAKQQGLDEDTYRAKLEQVTGQRSAAKLNDTDLARAIDAFDVKPTENPHHAKIKALFIACWNLGALESGTDAALDAFVKRQTGKARLAFVTPGEGASVTEALKDILKRNGFAIPASDPGGMEARRQLLIAQWTKLHELGAVRVGHPWALDKYVSAPRYLTCAGSIINMKRHQLDKCARDLGAWIRRVQSQKAKVA